MRRAPRLRSWALAAGAVWSSSFGCAGSPVPGGHSLRPARAGEIRAFSPRSAAAEHYNDARAQAVPASPIEVEVTRSVTDTAAALGQLAPAPDDRLFAVAGELAQIVDGAAPPPYEIVEFSLAHHGILEPSPQIVVVVADKDDVAGVGAELRRKLPAILGAGPRPRFSRLGVGVADLEGRMRVVLALQASFVRTEPFPRKIPQGGAAVLRGHLLAPYAEPELYVTDPAGKVTELPLSREGVLGFRGEIFCRSGDGKQQVEIVGHDASGSAVLANFPVYCGQEPPASMRMVLHVVEAVADAQTAEGRIFVLLNQDRQKAGLPPLVRDERAAGIARAHSEDMHEGGFVAHVSPTTGDAQARAARSGLVVPLLLENIARAYSPEEAQAGLMNSPGHRQNVLSPEATHLGVGVALGREVGGQRELYVTQVFFREPPRLDVTAALVLATRSIAEARARASIPAVTEDRELVRLAQDFATRMGAGESWEGLEAQADRALDKLGARFRAVQTVVLILGDPAQVGSSRVLDARVTHMGVGLARGDEPTLGKGMYFVVIFLGR